MPGRRSHSGYDPVHEPVKPSAALESVRFLLGHFEGTVELPLEQRSIHKEVVGCWEAGGRFLSLRMAATYRRTNGSWDRHQAFIILGPDEETGALVSRAYTDGGMIHEFHIVIEERRLMFADRVPHHVPAVAARKVLTPTARGYEETLELDRGLGVFEPYYSIPIQRKNGSAAS